MPTVTIQLTIGPVHTLTQNIVYALPARRCLLYADAGTLTQSSDGTNFTAITLANQQAEVGGAFIKSTAGDTDIRLVAA